MCLSCRIDLRHACKLHALRFQCRHALNPKNFQGGQHILDLVDYFGVAFVIFLTSILEVAGIVWVYGLSNFLSDIEFMLNMKIGWYWKICWGAVIPVGLSVILLYSLIIAEELTYNGVPYPTSAIGKY